MAFFAVKFSPDNEARCRYSWQRRTNNDEQRGSSRTALKTICAASTAGSGAQTRASNAACTTSNRATRQRLKGLATRSAAHTAGSGRHEQQRATSNRTGALRIQLAAPHKQRRATRLVRNSTGDDLRCEYNWQRRTSNAACATSTIDSEDRCEQCKQRPHATYLNHTRRVSWQVAQAQTNPKFPTYLCRQKSADFNSIFSFSLVSCLVVVFLSTPAVVCSGVVASLLAVLI